MRSGSTTVARLGVLLATLFATAGFVLDGTETGVLWGVVGYFAGKTIQSTYWTFASDAAPQ